MIDISRLRQGLDYGDDWVMFDHEGNVLDGEVPAGAGPATFIVAPVTEAVKAVEGGKVSGSVDRSKLWRVEAFLLNRIVVDQLENASFDIDALLDAVDGTGNSWQAVPRSAGT